MEHLGDVPDAHLGIDVLTSGARMFQFHRAFGSLSTGVTAIPDKAFMGCSALEKVSMGTRVESVGDYAFDGCESLKALAWRNYNIQVPLKKN